MKGPKAAGTIAKDRDSVVGQAGRAERPHQERPDPERRTTKVANQQPGGKGREGRKVKSLKIN